MSNGRKCKRPPPPSVHPLVHKLWDEMIKSGINQCKMADQAGVDRTTLQSWFYGTRTPTMHNLEACFNTIGFTLVVQRRAPDADRTS